MDLRTIDVPRPSGVLTMSFQEMLTAQDRNCDVAFARIEQAALRKQWTDAATALQVFLYETESHFNYEENVLFPALEAAAESADGPTSVMRNEHAQMRAFFGDLRHAVEKHDAHLLADAAETLLLLMQQHNAKEETVLFPMADRMLSDDLLARFAALQESG